MPDKPGRISVDLIPKGWPPPVVECTREIRCKARIHLPYCLSQPHLIEDDRAVALAKLKKMVDSGQLTEAEGRRAMRGIE